GYRLFCRICGGIKIGTTNRIRAPTINSKKSAPMWNPPFVVSAHDAGVWLNNAIHAELTIPVCASASQEVTEHVPFAGTPRKPAAGPKQPWRSSAANPKFASQLPRVQLRTSGSKRH